MPEAPRNMGGPEAPVFTGEPVQLSTILARGLRFEWHEAVAVVQGVCDLMRGAEAWESDVVPDADHIWLRSNGEMTVAPGTKRTGGAAAKSVSALARLLLSLVDEAQLPVQLRLVALSANSPTPPYTSVEEFSKALSYFERPGRPAAVRDLYRRAATLPADVTTGATRAAQREQVKQPAPPARPLRRRLVILAATAVVLIGASVALWWFLGRPPLAKLSSFGGQASSVVSRGFAAGKGFVASGVSAVRDRVAGTQAPPEPPPAAEPVQAAAQATSRGPGGGGTAGSQARRSSLAGPAASPAVTEPPIPSIPEFRAFDLGPDVKTPPINVAGAPGTTASSPRQRAVDEQLVVPTGDFPGPVAGSPGPVYSVADQDVIPPVPLRPKLPTVLPPGTRADELSLMDLLVSESGDVLSVRLVPPARDVREAMMLSAAKAWRFAPATRNGRAVRFQKRIWVIMSSSRSQ